jgi:uncharacterized protein
MSYTPLSDYRSSKPKKNASKNIVFVVAILLMVFVLFMAFNKHNKPQASESDTVQTSAQTEAAVTSQDEAEQAPAETQFKWGLQYAKGDGVAKSDAAAASWWKRAAEKGHIKAQVNVGWAYETGTGLIKDPDMALMWYRKAATQNDAIAQNKLGMFYENGLGVEKNILTAVDWYRKAALQGLADAQNKLGIIYAEGIGNAPQAAIPTDPNQASMPYVNAQMVIPKDQTAALEWFKKAANQGDVDAQYNLAVMYVNGMGTDKNDLQAYFWTTVSSAKGNKNAQDLNDLIAPRLTPEQKTQANIAAQAWVPQTTAGN